MIGPVQCSYHNDANWQIAKVAVEIDVEICIETPDKETWDKAQQACFKRGWDWEREEWPEWDDETGKDVWKEDPEFTLNDDSWDETVTHLCVVEGMLCTNNIEDGDPTEDDYKLMTIKDVENLAVK